MNTHEDSSQDTSTPNMLLLSSILSLGLTYMYMLNNRVQVIKACHEKGNENFQIILQSKMNCIPTSHTIFHSSHQCQPRIDIVTNMLWNQKLEIFENVSKHSLLATRFFKGGEI
jgi:hypothetical protein